MPLRRLAALLTVRTRRRLARSHRWWWVAVALLAAVAGGGVVEAMRRADAAATAWGSSVEVLVVDGPIEAGEPIRAAPRTVPRALLPDGAVGPAELAELAGRATGSPPTAHHRLADGAMLVRGDVVRGGVAGRIPDGWRSITVLELRPSGAAVGDRVDVAGDGLLVASHAVVIDVAPADGHVTLAVAAADAPAVAAADALGAVALLRHP